MLPPTTLFLLTLVYPTSIDSTDYVYPTGRVLPPTTLFLLTLVYPTSIDSTDYVYPTGRVLPPTTLFLLTLVYPTSIDSTDYVYPTGRVLPPTTLFLLTLVYPTSIDSTDYVYPTGRVLPPTTLFLLTLVYPTSIDSTDYVYPTGHYLEPHLGQDSSTWSRYPPNPASTSWTRSENVSHEDISANVTRAADIVTTKEELEEPDPIVPSTEAAFTVDEPKAKSAALLSTEPVVFALSDLDFILNTHEKLASPVPVFKSPIKLKEPEDSELCVRNSWSLERESKLREEKQD